MTSPRDHSARRFQLLTGYFNSIVMVWKGELPTPDRNKFRHGFRCSIPGDLVLRPAANVGVLDISPSIVPMHHDEVTRTVITTPGPTLMDLLQNILKRTPLWDCDQASSLQLCLPLTTDAKGVRQRARPSGTLTARPNRELFT